jgi:hypothetical protein
MKDPTLRPITNARLAVGVLALGSLAVLPACSTPRGVPSGSSLVTEATVKSSFQAPTDGMLWIFRTASRGSRGQLHYSGPIAAGQVLVIDPSMNKATIDGQELEVVLPGGDVWYQAYFRADRSVRRVLADRPAGGLPPADYREMEPGPDRGDDPAPAHSSQAAPPDSGRRGPE